MLDKRKLLSKMALIAITQSELAKQIGISKNTFNSKINGKSCFDTEQIAKLCEKLHIESDKEKVEIFLATSSHFRDGKTA